MHTPETEWISIQVAASKLGVSDKTIRRRIAEGSIVAKRFGPKLLRVDCASLVESGRAIGGAA